MKKALWGLLDLLIPDDIKEFEQSEELARARSLVFILLTNVLLSALTCVALLVAPLLLPYLTQLAIPIAASCTAGYAAALWMFRRWALYNVACNIYMAVGYCVIVYVTVTVPPADTTAVMLLLLTLPPLIALMASVIPAIVWLAIVAATPLVLTMKGDFSASRNYLIGWEVTCAGILLSINVSHSYRQGIVRRLNAERTRFEFAAAHDALTGLSNRATFDRRLRECIDFCKLHGTQAMLVFIDLDNFKPVNDTYGHQAGDIVLSTVADRLRQHTRKTDTVARLGGDEFAILLDQDCPDDLESLLRRMKQSVETPIEVFDNSLRVGCSYGVVVYPDDGLHPHQLAHKADERMYEAKRGNKTKAPSAEILNFPRAVRQGQTPQPN